MKIIKLSAIAAAVALASVSVGVNAKTTLIKKDDLEVYTSMAVEVEKMVFRDRPRDGGSTIDQWDNEVEFGLGAKIGENWEAYFEMEVDNLQDNAESNTGSGGDIEFTSAYVSYKASQFGAKAGVFRDDMAGGTRIWFREHMSGAKLQYDISDNVGVEFVSGILSEEGNAFADDRQVSWFTTTVGGAYGTLGLAQDGNQGGENITNDPDQDDVDDAFGDLYNVALGWGGKLGGISAEFEVNQNFGEAETGEDFKGYAAYGQISTKIGDHKPRLLVAYGSGDDDVTDNEVGEFRAARADTAFTKLMIDEGFVRRAVPSGSGDLAQDDIGNITLLQVGNTFQVNNIWRTDVSATYLALSEDNDAGDNYLGTEINFLNRWSLPIEGADVRLYLDLGYVFSGDAFGPDNVWLIEPGVRVWF
jgi:hypothetical protein